MLCCTQFTIAKGLFDSISAASFTAAEAVAFLRDGDPATLSGGLWKCTESRAQTTGSKGTQYGPYLSGDVFVAVKDTAEKHSSYSNACSYGYNVTEGQFMLIMTDYIQKQ